MKLLFTILFPLALISGQANAQTDSLQLRSAFSTTFMVTNYRWNSSSQELVENNTRFSLDGGFHYTRFFGQHWYAQTGVEWNRRRTIRPVNGFESHVSEHFTQIPIMVGYGAKARGEGKYTRRLNLAGGLYAAQLQRQGIALYGSPRLKMEKRVNDYTKFGFHTEASLMLLPKNSEKNLIHAFGVRSFMDIKPLTIRNNKSTPTFANYSGASLFYTLYFSSSRRRP